MKRQILTASIMLSLCCALAFWQVERSAQAGSAAAALPMATLTVTNTNDSGPGSLRQALTSAVDGDTINITAHGTITLVTELPVITKSITIIGPGANNLTISGNHRVGVFQVGNTSIACHFVVISNLTIADGKRDLGAGINFTGCILPGGIETTLTLDRVRFSRNNAAVAGGGIYAQGTVIVNNSTFTANTGGSHYLFDPNGGGGIYSSGGTLTVTNSTFSNNVAFSNSRYPEGYAVRSNGGAIHTRLAEGLTIINSTIVNNFACSWTGGGVYADAINRLIVANSLFAYNCGYDQTADLAINLNYQGRIPASISNSMFGINNSFAAYLNGVNGNMIGVNPLIGPIGDYGGETPTIPLLPGSPAIAAGATGGAGSGILGRDQRGASRYGGNDIGAFESRGFTLALASGDNQGARAGFAFSNPLSVTVASNFSEPVEGGQVTFTPPTSGLSAALAGNPAPIANGKATTGTVTANAVIGGPYNVTASAGRSNTVDFSLTNLYNTAPTFTPAAAISIQAGKAPVAVTVGTIADGETMASLLTVTRISGGTSFSIFVRDITNTNGTITALVHPICSSEPGTVRFQVSDGGLTGTGDFQISLLPNTLPTVGAYPNTSMAVGSSTTVTPASPPSDNGTILSVTATAPGLPGVYYGNTATGAITFSGVIPLGSYTVTVTLTDDCEATTQRTFTLTVSYPNNVPTITTQPAARTVCVGSAATFTVTAVNAVSYQWRKGGVAISGATASSYTTPVTTAADNGALYSVVITGNSGTSVTSSAATLAIQATVAITTQPTDQPACLGNAASFSVAATETNLTYQ